MRIASLGLTPVKGGRHVAHAELRLGIDGPVGDREFALADVARRRVLRTVAHPFLVDALWRREPERLILELDGRMHAAALPTAGGGRRVELEYWGRPTPAEVVPGPWAVAFGERLGPDVELTRTLRPGGFVFGAPVTVLTTGALRRLSKRLGGPVDPHRFRATAVIDTGDEDPEDSWIGREFELGEARIRFSAPVVRCAVIDIPPPPGTPTHGAAPVEHSRVLRELAGYRLQEAGIVFGLQAEVVRPGHVRPGAEFRPAP